MIITANPEIADLTGSRWFAVNVCGSDFNGVKTTDAPIFRRKG